MSGFFLNKKTVSIVYAKIIKEPILDNYDKVRLIKKIIEIMKKVCSNIDYTKINYNFLESHLNELFNECSRIVYYDIFKENQQKN